MMFLELVSKNRVGRATVTKQLFFSMPYSYNYLATSLPHNPCPFDQATDEKDIKKMNTPITKDTMLTFVMHGSETAIPIVTFALPR